MLRVSHRIFRSVSCHFFLNFSNYRPYKSFLQSFILPYRPLTRLWALEFCHMTSVCCKCRSIRVFISNTADFVLITPWKFFTYLVQRSLVSLTLTGMNASGSVPDCLYGSSSKLLILSLGAPPPSFSNKHTRYLELQSKLMRPKTCL